MWQLLIGESMLFPCGEVLANHKPHAHTNLAEPLPIKEARGDFLLT